MTTQQFLQGIRKNAERVNAYQLGMDGTDGMCDCIGLVIGAIRLMGGEWKGTHGSNYAARNEMQSLNEIVSASVLEVGDLVFKAKSPGQSGYALPEKYSGHPDRNDYYHVGVVTGITPLEITHCTSVDGGIKKDSSLGSWQYHGRLKCLSAEMPATALYRITGGRLNLRKGPGETWAVLTKMENGTVVEASAHPEKQGWMHVSYHGQTGYAMARYLQPLSPLEQLEETLQQALRLLQSIRGAGA